MISKTQKQLFERQSQIAKSIAHPVRIAILDFLNGGEQCVCDIAEYVGSERSNVSRHLSVMVQANVLEFRKDGLKVIYKVKTPCALRFLACLKECLKEQMKQEQKLLEVL